MNLQDQLGFSYPNRKGDKGDNHNKVVNNVSDVKGNSK